MTYVKLFTYDFCASPQIRRAVLQLLFPDKPFHWVLHISIAVCLLFAVNLLVIFVENIRDIFGFIGESVLRRTCKDT